MACTSDKMMSALIIHRSSKSVLPYACFLFYGLSFSRNLNFSCRAFSQSTRLSHHSRLSNGLCGKRCRWMHRPQHHGEGRRYANNLFVRYATAKSSEEESSKWEFHDDNNRSSNLIRNILVVGDGDLSYSSEIASELNQLSINLYATVLEAEDVHKQVYQYSKTNTDIIASYGQKVLFGVDATNLTTNSYFGDVEFDRIQFNFPHWRGKANNRYNRQLLNEFLESAATVLSPRGEIFVALCDGQGGCSATSLQEWRGSWTASMFAAEHGLLLSRVFPYEPEYRLCSHRGVDRAFNLGPKPEMHVFRKPDGMVEAPKDIQLCCRHELHIEIPDDDDAASTICSLDQILAGDAIESIIQCSCVPEGIRVEVPARQILEIHETQQSSRIAVFLVVYCSERHPVTREMADEWREMAELEVSKFVPLRENRRGRTVSHPFPYPALHPEIKYHTTGKR